MRFGLSIAAIVLIVSGCKRPVAHMTAEVTLYPGERTIGTSIPKDCFATAVGRQPSGRWLGVRLGRSHPKQKPHIEIHCSDSPNGAVKVEVTFKGDFDPNLASLTFPHLSKVENVMDSAPGGNPDRPYVAWTQKGENFELKSPESARKITFLAWPHVH